MTDGRFASHVTSGADIDLLYQAAASLTPGSGVERFESAVARYVGAEHAVALNTGTAALHAAYSAMGIARGDAILTSPITDASTVNAALYLGGEVRFADVNPRTGVLDPDAADDAAEECVKAVVPVHFAGEVAPMDVIAAIAEAREWVVIEAAGDALGARYRTSDGSEHQVGGCDHSAACCFSLRLDDRDVAGTAGVVTTNDPAIAARLRRLRNHGISDSPPDGEASPGAWHREQRALGFDYRLPDILGAMGERRLELLPGWLERRAEIVKQYRAALADHPRIQLLTAPLGSIGAHTLFVIQVPADRRRAIFDALRTSDVDVDVHHVPVYRHPFYRDFLRREIHLPGAERFYASALTLPLSPTMTKRDIERVVATLEEALERVG